MRSSVEELVWRPESLACVLTSRVSATSDAGEDRGLQVFAESSCFRPPQMRNLTHGIAWREDTFPEPRFCLQVSSGDYPSQRLTGRPLTSRSQ